MQLPVIIAFAVFFFNSNSPNTQHKIWFKVRNMADNAVWSDWGFNNRPNHTL